jgi:hypothetical protein
VLLGLAMAGCRAHSSDVSTDQWFEDVTAELGVDFVNDPGPVGSYFFPQIMARRSSTSTTMGGLTSTFFKTPARTPIPGTGSFANSQTAGLRMSVTVRAWT